MAKTSGAPGRDISAEIPAIADLARISVRLHPRPGNPGVWESSVGGPVAWPLGEGIPVCSLPHREWSAVGELDSESASRMAALSNRQSSADLSVEEVAVLSGLDHGQFIVDGRIYAQIRLESDESMSLFPVAQLRSEDFPEASFPLWADTAQVLWCPFDHFLSPNGYSSGPTVSVFWRQMASLKGASRAIFDCSRGGREGVATIPPCSIFPERVVEYPDIDDLPGYVIERMDSLGISAEYQYGLSVVRGWKVGGWPSWISSDARHIACPDCDGDVSILLRIDTREWDGGSPRWRPVEDLDISDDLIMESCDPTGLDVPWSELRIFVCKAYPDHDIVMDIQ